MARRRAMAVLLDGGSIAMIRRDRRGETYYVVPGGGVEDGETPEEACVREAWEELGLDVEIVAPFARLRFHGDLHEAFLVRRIGGRFGTGGGAEYGGSLPPEQGSYHPVWLPLDALSGLDIRPRCVVEAAVDALRDGFGGIRYFLEEPAAYAETDESGFRAQQP